MQGSTATTRHEVRRKKKEAQKDQSIKEISLERTYSKKVSVNSILKAI